MRIYCALILLLVGCSGDSVSDDVRINCASAAQAECHYFAEIQDKIQRRFAHYQRYSGQRCEVSAERQPDGGYAVLGTRGDEALCLQALQVVASARDLPLPPENAASPVMFVFSPP